MLESFNWQLGVSTYITETIYRHSSLRICQRNLASQVAKWLPYIQRIRVCILQQWEKENMYEESFKYVNLTQ